MRRFNAWLDDPHVVLMSFGFEPPMMAPIPSLQVPTVRQTGLDSVMFDDYARYALEHKARDVPETDP